MRGRADRQRRVVCSSSFRATGIATYATAAVSVLITARSGGTPAVVLVTTSSVTPQPSDRAANRSRHLAPGVHSQYRDTEERQVGLLHQDLARVLGKARDQAKSLTSHSSSLYLALVSIRKRLLTEDPAPPPVSQFVPELEGLVALCGGKLAPIKPLLEEALRIARR